MSKMPYGAKEFPMHDDTENDTPWTKLATIREYLEDGEPIPANLAMWLAGAIRDGCCEHDEKKKSTQFLHGLGIIKPHKRPSHPEKEKWAQRLRQLVNLHGYSLSGACAEVLQEMPNDGENEVSINTLKNWFHATTPIPRSQGQ